MEDNETVTPEQIAAVDRLQSVCADIYLQIMSTLKPGQTEMDIAESIRALFQRHDIRSFWYDIPIFVLIGAQRFRDMPKPDYTVKNPSSTVLLKAGDSIFIDMHPIDAHGYWGDFSGMTVFQPRQGIDDEQVAFLLLMQTIQRKGIAAIAPHMTISSLVDWYTRQLEKESIIFEDARGTFGHSMHDGGKKHPDGRDKRHFLSAYNPAPLAGTIWAVEPGGYKTAASGTMLVGRWEDCIYVSPEGKATVLGHQEPLPILF